MCVKIEITNEDVKYAERILFHKENVFDKERIEFIKNLETIDLQAVPGSGKTTALLAKLLILDRKLPLPDNAGILVISHTNNAVDEIKNRISKYCTKLFEYPNFVGTIQSFVDTFLAIPYYSMKYNKKPYRIDNEIYEEEIEKFLNNIYNMNITLNLRNKIYQLKKANKNLFYSVRFTLDENRRVILTKELNSEKLRIKKSKSQKDYKDIEKKEIYNFLFSLKYKILKDKGILHYDDAYFLANCYLKKYPRIKELLQKRFKYVFVDEMQDMDVHQYNILEKIFYDSEESTSIFQRIGDKNQAIYNGNNIKIEEIWNNREKVLYLKGSHRLNPNVSIIVEKLALNENIEIKGLNENSLKPHIIIFDDNTIEEVIPTFAKLVKFLQNIGKIPDPVPNKIMAIAWRVKSPGEKVKNGQIRLDINDYFSFYQKSTYAKKIDYKCLKDYIIYSDENNFNTIRKNIINALLRILRLEDIKDENKNLITERKLYKYLRENYYEKYEEFKLKIYKWSRDVLDNNLEIVINDIENYISQFLNIFGKRIKKTKIFIKGNVSYNNESSEDIEFKNYYEYNGIKVEIGSVHSAKGQTHTATLYLETFYQGNHESEYLKNIFTLNNIKTNKKYLKQAARMTYVGFSRPTHLLCFAVHKARMPRDIEKDAWEIINVNDFRFFLNIF